ncbi:gibberellin 20-oxidase-like protein [Syzygium oleosum]|uniref:gibberellin 20-oxidase-like protein n=1 Tax=Syzygium oleosum TaxID=219896 RepID=UPI0011D23F53|nr:gibberellin 20-oxidase-like protein [Syzygium oleosum]
MTKSKISIQLPVLDLSQPVESTFLSALSQACQEWGFFYVINHGIPESIFSELCLLSEHIFSLPQELKLKLGPSSSIQTYTPRFIASPYFESLRVSGPNFMASAKASADELFGSQNHEISNALQEYGSKVIEVSKIVIEVLLKCLGNDYEEKYHKTEFSNCHGYLRIVNYSPPENVKEKEVEGLGMHTDMSCITLVYQDEIGGLQMRSKEGEWLNIDPCKGSLVVNIGDLMQAWSNGRFRSSEHRVVLKQPVNRHSLAFFWCFEDEKVILAPNDVVGKGNARIYKPFVCADYLKFRESNEEGKFEKIGYTVKDFAGVKIQATVTTML